jgi:hypothetical protein
MEIKYLWKAHTLKHPRYKVSRERNPKRKKYMGVRRLFWILADRRDYLCQQ